jgi:hypothetical protein
MKTYIIFTCFRNASPNFHLKRRWIARLQMWLQALYELDPEVAVLLVGTHADLIPDGGSSGSSSTSATASTATATGATTTGGGLADAWRRITEALLDPARSHHLRRNADLRRRPTSNCLLCSAKYLAVRRTAPALTPAPHPVVSGNGNATMGGDTSSSNSSSTSSDNITTRMFRRVVASTNNNNSSSSSNTETVAPVVRSFGYVDLSIAVGANGATTSGSTNGHVTTSGSSGGKSAPSLRFPHVLGYYETEIASSTAAAAAQNSADPSRTSGQPAKRSIIGDGLYSKVIGGGGSAQVSSVYEQLRPAVGTTTSSSSGQSSSSRPSESIGRLLSAVLRLTEARQEVTCNSSMISRWSTFGRRLTEAAFVERRFPLLSVDGEVVKMTSIVNSDGRRVLVDADSLSAALLYLHRRGRVVYFPGSVGGGGGADVGSLSRFVCASPAWFIRTVRRAASGITGGGIVSRDDLRECLKRELERSSDVVSSDARSLRLSLNATYSSSSNYSAVSCVPDEVVSWLIEALIRLGTCFLAPRCSIRAAVGGGGDETNNNGPFLVFPSLLETGSPSSDVWPDNPGVDQRQVTCEFRVRSLRPGFFADIVRWLSVATVAATVGSSTSCDFFFRCRELRRMLRPAAVSSASSSGLLTFLADHVTFKICVDVAGCDDCRLGQQAAVRGGCPSPGTAAAADAGDVRVHVSLRPDLDVVRVQCRGASNGVCCAMRAVLDFLDLYLDDAPLDDRPSPPDVTPATAPPTKPKPSTYEDDNISSVSGGSPVPSYRSQGDVNLAGIEPETDEDDDDYDDADDERLYFLLCPKCVLLHVDSPDRIRVHRRLASQRFPVAPAHRKPVCQRWHHLGSWHRAAIGDYRKFTAPIVASSSTAPSVSSSSTSGRSASPAARHPPPLPDYEHPHVVLMAPPGVSEAIRNWYVYSRAAFLDEPFDVHLLCENPAYWHFVDGSAYHLRPPANQRSRAVRSTHRMSSASTAGYGDYTSLVYSAVPSRLQASSPPPRTTDGRPASFPAQLVALAVAVVRAIHCVQAGRTVAPVIDRLCRTHGDLLSAFDEPIDDDDDDSTSNSKKDSPGEPILRPSPLTRTRDRIAAMLALVVSGVAGGSQAEHFRRTAFDLPQDCVGIEPSMIANSIVFRSTGKSGSRREMAHLLQAYESPSGRRFGRLRAVFVGHEVRWVCDRHFQELRGLSTSWPDGASEGRSGGGGGGGGSGSGSASGGRR